MHLKILFALQFISVILFGQDLPKTIALDSGKIKLCALANYETMIRPQVFHALVSYLRSQKLPLKNYYVDIKSTYISDTLYVAVWDKVGIINSQKSERMNDSLARIELNASRKLRYPKPVGNPGNCFTLIYDLTADRIIEIAYWQ
ncbi:MAG: hypothetical protein JWQ27_2693 [Ferruginibacter sp.]|nr:hypothetical protein [Ferruginibacter sp.]